jgi:glycosyltransferase involved in cell wall biosynthesis
VEVPPLEGRDLARVAMRDELGIPADDRILLWVGRFHEAKRPLQAIQAFVAANPSGCHLVMVGFDETLKRTDLLRVVPKSASDRIHVLGELRGRSLAAAWLSADGYISLSAKENFGYTTADALAYGLPIILSAGHDLAYELPGSAQGKMAFGWLLPDDTPSSAAHAITEWSRAVTTSQDYSLSTASIHARAWVAEYLSVERFRIALEALAEDSGC